jgi:hypothetical protein
MRHPPTLRPSLNFVAFQGSLLDQPCSKKELALPHTGARIMYANADHRLTDPGYFGASLRLPLLGHKAPTPEPVDDPLPGEHPVPQEEPVPSPNPEIGQAAS